MKDGMAEAFDRQTVKRYTECCCGGLPSDLAHLRASLLARQGQLPPLVLPHQPADSGLLTLHRFLDTQRRLIREQWREVLPALASAGIDSVVIKGFSLEGLYPANISRRAGDLDLVLADEASFWRATEILDSLGYWLFGFYRVGNRPAGAGAHGFAKFDPPEQSGPALELQYGGFVISGATLLPASTLWMMSSVAAESLRYRTPTPVGHMLILLAEIYGRPTIRGRDLFDFTILLQRLDEDDWALLLERVEEYSLAPMLRRLASIVIDAQPDPDARLASWASSIHPIDAAWFVRRNLYHVLPYLAGRTDRWIAARATVQNYLDERWNAWGERNWSWLVRQRARWHDPGTRLAQGRFTLLVPVASQIRGNLQWEHDRYHQYLRTPVGCYLASVHGMESPDELEAAGRACGRVFAAERGEG